MQADCGTEHARQLLDGGELGKSTVEACDNTVNGGSAFRFMQVRTGSFCVHAETLFVKAEQKLRPKNNHLIPKQ